MRIDAKGEPIPQGSKKVVPHKVTRKPMLIDDNGPKLKPWREKVAGAARAAKAKEGPGLYPMEGPVAVDMVFYVARPKTVKRMYPHVKPDGDKYVRAIFDALTAAGVWKDDGQAVDHHARKRYADDREPGVVIHVRSMS